MPKSWEEIAPEPFAIEIRGKRYEFPVVGAKLGLLLLASFDGDEAAIAEVGTTGRDLWRRLLGPVYDALVADDVPYAVISRAGFTAAADFRYGRDSAERIWESGLNPEAQAALVAAAQTAATTSPKGSTPSPSSAEAPATQSPASTSGTRSQTTTRRTSTPTKKPQPRSRGRNSSLRPA
jgi:hypothetical protein